MRWYRILCKHKKLIFQRTLIGNKRQLLSYSAAVNIAKNILKTKKNPEIWEKGNEIFTRCYSSSVEKSKKIAVG